MLNGLSIDAWREAVLASFQSGNTKREKCIDWITLHKSVCLFYERRIVNELKSQK